MTQTEIAYSRDKKGRKIAFYWSVYSQRWLRMNLEDARNYLACGMGLEVEYQKRIRRKP